jgi:hypothetical protein
MLEAIFAERTKGRDNEPCGLAPDARSCVDNSPFTPGIAEGSHRPRDGAVAEPRSSDEVGRLGQCSRMHPERNGGDCRRGD